MDILNIEAGVQTPSVNCNPSEGLIELKGKSIPEDPFDEVFRPILDWVKEYSLNSKPKTIVNIELEYFNTSSSKYLLDTFRILENIHINVEDSEILINWYYEEDDEDMLEAGQDYQAIIKIPFEMIISKPRVPSSKF